MVIPVRNCPLPAELKLREDTVVTEFILWRCISGCSFSFLSVGAMTFLVIAPTGRLLLRFTVLLKFSMFAINAFVTILRNNSQHQDSENDLPKG